MGDRIAIAVRGHGGLSAALDSRFGRAGAFLIVDAEKLYVLELVENWAADSEQGAAVEATEEMSRKRVSTVIAGSFGPVATRGLEALGVEAYAAPEAGTARDVLEAYRAGRLERIC
ncbi:MAG: NifB/NifX family molybdenum-iron cluster-binding protein [Polyangia bacterium]